MKETPTASKVSRHFVERCRLRGFRNTAVLVGKSKKNVEKPYEPGNFPDLDVRECKTAFDRIGWRQGFSFILSS
jgi:hypothetical protein